MSKLMINTGSIPLHTDTGAPIPSGWVCLSDEVDQDAHGHVLQHVAPSDVPENLNDAGLTAAAREHLTELRARNAEAAAGDDADVKAKRGSAAK